MVKRKFPLDPRLAIPIIPVNEVLVQEENKRLAIKIGRDHFQAKEKRNHGQVWEQIVFYYREPEMKRGKKLHDIPEQNKKIFET